MTEIQTILNRFDEGMTNDIRNSYESSSKGFLVARPRARILNGFDPFTASSKMIPHYDDQADSTGNTEKLCQILTRGSKQYALGVVSGQSYVKIFERTISVSPQGAWGASTSGADSTNARSEVVFVDYNDGTSDLLFGLTGGRYIWQYNITTPAFNGTLFDLTSYTNTAQGLVHSKDDICYIPVDNKIYSKNGSGAFALGLTLPINSIITSIWESGNYLAIATKSKSIGGRSIIYLWDRNSVLATISEKIDCGTNDIVFGQELEGYNIVVSSFGNTSIVKTPKVLFSYVFGSGLKTFAEFDASNITVLFGYQTQKTNGRIYFMMNTEIAGTVYMGVWSIGRNKNGQFGYCMEFILNNGATTFTASDVPLGFQLLGDYLTVTYRISSTYVARMTNATVFSTSSIKFESLIFNDGDSDVTKKLIGATVMFEPLSTTGITGTPTVVLKYKADNDSAFTEIFSYTTVGGISHGARNIESTGVNLPEYKEIQWQILSTGNAVITGLKWKSEIMEGKNQVY